jgi:hypothetical protein
MGAKRATARQGIRVCEYLTPIPYVANDGSGDKVMIEVIASVVKRFDMLDDSDAQAHGYINRAQLKMDMEQVYPGIEPTDNVTVLFFNVLPEVMDETAHKNPFS